MNQWPVQSDQAHTLEIMVRQLDRVIKEHARGDSTYDELVEARADVETARCALARYEARRAAVRLDERVRIEAAKIVRLMVAGRV